MNILFLLPSVGQPRYAKRIRSLQRLGVRATVLAFDRHPYGSNDLPNLELLPPVANSRYAQRLCSLIRALPTLRRKARSVEVIYAFGLDMALLAAMATLGCRRCLAYEVGDVREASLGSGMRARVIRLIERHVLSRARVLIATSPGYFLGYYNSFDSRGARPARLVVENKIDPFQPPPVAVPPPIAIAPPRIGYFGVIRCWRSIDLLTRLGESGGAPFAVYLRGIERRGVEDLEAISERHPHMFYGGPYEAPGDLGRMYGQVDLSWIAHHHALPNLRWARANRFYEACYYRRPMIAQAGTLDAEVVQTHDLGIVIDLLHPETALSLLLSVTSEDMARWRRNLDALPRNIYEYTDEHERLLQLLGAKRSCGRPAAPPTRP